MLEQLSQGTSTNAFLVWTAILVAIAVAGGIAAYVFHRRARAMTATPTSKIGSAAAGCVEFEGRAKPVSEAGLKSPLTGTPCVWYEYEITRQMGGHGRDSHSRWVKVDGGRSEEPFVLADETGECLVDPEGAKVITASLETDRWVGRSERPTGGPEKRGSRFGLFPGQSYGEFGFGNGLWFSTRKDYRYTERRIRPGAHLYVLGRLEKERSDSGSGEASANELLRTWKQDRADLLNRFDADGDGQIDGFEWETARREAESQAARNRTPASSGEPIGVLGAPRDRSHPFLISAIPQRELLARYRLLTRIGLAVAIVAIVGMGVLIAGS
jgi:hypothetical protein